MQPRFRFSSATRPPRQPRAPRARAACSAGSQPPTEACDGTHVGLLHWSRDHRVYHKYSETRADPHNALRGFFFAHVGWLLFKKDPRVKFAGQHVPMDDLLALPELR